MSDSTNPFDIEALRTRGFLVVEDPARTDVLSPCLVCGNCESMVSYEVPARTLPPIAPGQPERQIPAAPMHECRWGPPTTIVQQAIASPALLAVLMPQPKAPTILGAGPTGQQQQRVSIPHAIPISAAGFLSAYPPVAPDFPACGRFEPRVASQNGTTTA